MAFKSVKDTFFLVLNDLFPGTEICSLCHSGAKERTVQICGDFNDWAPSESVCEQQGGAYAFDVRLSPGIYIYILIYIDIYRYIDVPWSSSSPPPPPCLPPGTYTFYFLVDGEVRCSDAYLFAEGTRRDEVHNMLTSADVC